MAITFFGVNSNPADNGTSTATTVAVTPPVSMVNGDLVLFYGYQRGTATRAISATGGQTWNTGASATGSGLTIAYAMFWCIYNGTWSADPSIVFSAGTNTNAVMLVFRPTTAGNSWALDPGCLSGNPTSNAAAAIQTIAFSSFASPVNNSTVSVGSWITDDDNTWGTLSGSGWSKTGLGAQYRNTSGNDVSSTYAYNIKTTAAAVADVSQTELTNGNDPCLIDGFTFYEFTPVAPSFIPRMALMGVG
jgi:hypothetical protein